MNKQDDTMFLSSLNQARDSLRKHVTKFDDNYLLPECASTPYYRPAITSIVEKNRRMVDDSSLSLKDHSRISCEVLGSLACSDCQKNRLQLVAKSNHHLTEGKLPQLDSRYLAGVRQLREMTAYSTFQPVLPAYHHLEEQTQLEYYSAWAEPFRKTVRLPIITNYEHMQRVSRKGEKTTPVNKTDNLPTVASELRTDSNKNTPKVPANSQIHTPNPSDEMFIARPPIIDNWREWSLHHIHV